MIDITVDDNHTKIEVDMKEFIISNQDDMITLLALVIYKACYSGESITLWRAEGDEKFLVHEYFSNPKRY